MFIFFIVLCHSVLSRWNSTFFFFEWDRFPQLRPSNVPISLYMCRCWWLMKIMTCVFQTKNTLFLLDICCVFLGFAHAWDSLRLIQFSPLGWLRIGHRSRMLEPCFIHYHVSRRKFVFIAIKQLETLPSIINSLLYLFEWWYAVDIIFI